MTHLLAHLLTHLFGLSPAQDTRNCLLYTEAMESDNFACYLPGDGDDDVQREQSEDEGFSRQEN